VPPVRACLLRRSYISGSGIFSAVTTILDTSLGSKVVRRLCWTDGLSHAFRRGSVPRAIVFAMTGIAEWLVSMAWENTRALRRETPIDFSIVRDLRSRISRTSRSAWGIAARFWARSQN